MFHYDKNNFKLTLNPSTANCDWKLGLGTSYFVQKSRLSFLVSRFCLDT